jgi:antitoxin component of MazEF toxin-antitoxin module
MQRSLVKHGDSTLMVSLPAKWIKEQGLQKGNQVNLTQKGEDILIKKVATNLTRSIAIELENESNDHIRAIIPKAYREGFNLITVTFKKRSTFKLIQSTTACLIGCEIIEHTKHKVTIKNMITEHNFNSKECIRKLVLLTKSFGEILVENIKIGKELEEEDTESLREDAYKFRNWAHLALRQHNIYEGYKELFIIERVEQGITFLKWLANSYNKNRSKGSKEFMNLLEETLTYFDICFQMYFTKDSRYMDYVLENRRRLLEECETFSSKEQHLVQYLAMFIHNTHEPKSVIIA